MNQMLAHLVATYIYERNTSEATGRVVYVLARDGLRLRAGEIYIEPVAYAYIWEMVKMTGDDNIPLSVHWFDDSPLQHVMANPSIPIKDIVLHSVSPKVVIKYMRRLKQRIERQAMRN